MEFSCQISDNNDAADTSLADQISGLDGKIDTVSGTLSSMDGKLDSVSGALGDTSESGALSDKLTTIHDTIVDWRESEAAETETDPVTEYIVKRGDTLMDICRKFDIDYYQNKEQLQELNKKEKLGQIEPGETLILPVPSEKKPE